MAPDDLIHDLSVDVGAEAVALWLLRRHALVLRLAVLLVAMRGVVVCLEIVTLLLG